MGLVVVLLSSLLWRPGVQQDKFKCSKIRDIYVSKISIIMISKAKMATTTTTRRKIIIRIKMTTRLPATRTRTTTTTRETSLTKNTTMLIYKLYKSIHVLRLQRSVPLWAAGQFLAGYGGAAGWWSIPNHKGTIFLQLTLRIQTNKFSTKKPF